MAKASNVDTSQSVNGDPVSCEPSLVLYGFMFGDRKGRGKWDFVGDVIFIAKGEISEKFDNNRRFSE